jgi:hypothetical protein
MTSKVFKTQGFVYLYGTAVEHRSLLNRSGICDGINRCELLSWVVVRPSVSFSHLNLLLCSDKKIFKILANENTLWTLAAMLDFKSAPKTQIW